MLVFHMCRRFLCRNHCPSLRRGGVLAASARYGETPWGSSGPGVPQDGGASYTRKIATYQNGKFLSVVINSAESIRKFDVLDAVT